MNLQEIRAKYPQYDDLSDDQVATGLHKAYYSDMPYEDFTRKISYTPKPPSTNGLDVFDLEAEKEKDGVLSSIGKTAALAPERLLGATGGIMESYGRNEADDFSDQPKPPVFNALPGTANSLTAIPRYASELIKYYADMSSFGLGKIAANLTPEETKQEMIRSGQALSSESEYIISKESPRPDGNIAQFAADTTAGITDLGASILVGIVTSPVLAAAVMGGQVYGHKYNEYQTKLTAPVEQGGKGLDRDAADKLARGAAQFAALAEGLTETIPAAAIMKRGGKWVEKLVNAGITEGIQESVMAAIEQSYDATQLKDMSLAQAIMGIDWVEVGYNGLVGAAVGTSLATITPHKDDTEGNNGALNAEDTLGTDDNTDPPTPLSEQVDSDNRTQEELNQAEINNLWGEPETDLVDHGLQQNENGLQLTPEELKANENQKIIDSVPMGDITPAEVTVGWNDGVEIEKKYLSDYENKPSKTSDRIKQNRAIDWSNDDLATVIRKMGGLNTEKDGDWKGRLSQLNESNNTFGLPGIEQKGDKGLTIEQLAEALSQSDILNLKDEQGNYDSQLMAEYLSRLEDGDKVWLNTTDPKHRIDEQSKEDARAEAISIANQQQDQKDLDRYEAQLHEILNNEADHNAIATEFNQNPASYFNAKSLEELIREANAIDPESVERITDTNRDDSYVAIQLSNLINKGNQNGLSITPVAKESEKGNESTGLQAPAEPASDSGSEAGSAENGIPDTEKDEKNGLNVATVATQKLDEDGRGDGGTVNPEKPNYQKPNKKDAVKPTEGFVATHKLADGTPVIAVPDEENVWRDKKGDEYEESSVDKIKQDVSENGLKTENLPDLSNSIDVAAHQAATSPFNSKPEPTEKEKENSDYDKGKFTFEGIDIEIENPKGSMRTGTSEKGKKWSVELQSHYGDIVGTKGADGDPVDVFFIKKEAGTVFVIDQINPDTKKFDEHKVIIGPHDKEGAHREYLKNYEKNWQGAGAITEMDIDEFKDWVKDKNKTKKALAYKEPSKENGLPHEVNKPEENENIGKFTQYHNASDVDNGKWGEITGENGGTRAGNTYRLKLGNGRYVNSAQSHAKDIRDDNPEAGKPADESNEIVVKPVKSPLVITKRFTDILNKELKKAGVDSTHTDITIHFRSPDYSESSGGYQPVEVSINPDGSINYITDFYKQGGLGV